MKCSVCGHEVSGPFVANGWLVNCSQCQCLRPPAKEEAPQVEMSAVPSANEQGDLREAVEAWWDWRIGYNESFRPAELSLLRALVSFRKTALKAPGSPVEADHQSDGCQNADEGPRVAVRPSFADAFEEWSDEQISRYAVRAIRFALGLPTSPSAPNGGVSTGESGPPASHPPVEEPEPAVLTKTWEGMVEDGPGYGYIRTPQGSFGWGTRVHITVKEIREGKDEPLYEM